MRCPSCGRESPPRSRFCTHCGARLQSEEVAAYRAGPAASRGKERLAALQEELSSIEFALQELDTALQEGASAPETWKMVRHRLLAHRQELEAKLIRLYGSLPASEAMGYLTDSLKLHPRNVQAHLERGRVHQQMRHYDSAVEEYILAASLDPGQADPHLRLAQLYELLHRKAQALYEYTTYIALESDPGRRQAVEASVKSLEQELVPERGGFRDQTIDETPQRLEYLLSTLKEFLTHPHLNRRVLQQLTDRYTQRLDALPAPPVPEPVPTPPVTTSGHRRLSVPAASPGPAAPAQPPKPPAAPPVPREPFDWGAFWAALFSERTLTAILGFGVLLVAISSLALLVDVWRRSDSYAAIWPMLQGILVGELILLLVAGYVVKERLKLHLSGLAILTIAALWIPLNMGAAMFKLFTNQLNVARDVAGGYYPTVPGIGVPLDLPTAGWLIVAATCIPTWGLLTFRFKGHLLTHGTVASVGATVALFLAVLGVAWPWAIAALAVLTIPLLLIWRYLRQTSFRVIAEPLFWTAQATLSAIALVLLIAYILGETGSYPLVLVGVAGMGLYALAHRFSPNLTYEYVFAGLPVIALLFALAEGNVLPFRYYDALLIGISAIYMVVGRVREKRYHVELLRSSQWPALQPAYAIGYVCAAAAILWPSFEPVSRLSVLYGAAVVTLVSGRWFSRALWTYLASLLFVAAFLLTLDQVDQLSLDYWSVALGVLAWVYLAGGVALRRAPAHALPLFIGAVVLSVASLIWAASTADLAVLSLALPMAIGTYIASALLIHRGLYTPLARSLGDAVRFCHRIYVAIALAPENAAPSYPGPLLDEQATKRWGSALFMALAAALAPVWTTLVRLWADSPALWTGLDFMALAFLYSFVAYRLTRRELRLHTWVILTLGMLLALAAPIYHAASVGSSWLLVGILYADVALVALAAALLRQDRLLYLAAMLLLAPFFLTLDLIGVSPLLWSTPLMVLGVAYMGLGVLLRGRLQTTAANPFYQVGFGISAMALAWTAVWVLTRWWDSIPDTALVGERLFMSAGLFLGAAAYSIAAYRREDARFGHLGAWVLAAALGIVLDGLPLSAGGTAIAVAMGAVAYVVAGSVLRGTRPGESAGGVERRPVVALPRKVRLGDAFSLPLLVAGFGVALVSLGMATFDLLNAQKATWSVNLVYMINVGLLGASAYLIRRPGFAHGAATLFVLPFTLVVYDLFGSTSELLTLPSAALAFGWAGLAIGYLALGLMTERRAPKYSGALPALGCLLLLAAAIASLGSAERQSVVFGVIVVAAGASAFLTHRRLTSSFVDLVSEQFAFPVETMRRYTVVAFVAVASLLTPLWGLEMLALFTREATVQGLVLASGAPIYVLIGALIVRRTVSLYAWPVYVAGYGITLVAPLLTLPSQPLNIITLAVGSATYALSTYIFRRSTWSPLLLYPAAGLAAASYSLGIGLLPLDSKYVGLALLPGAVASLGAGWLLHRWVARPSAPTKAALVARYIGTPSALAWQVPFLLVGHGLSLAAVVLSLPDESLRLVALLAVTGIYAASLSAFRTWAWLYPLLLSAHLAFASLVTLPGFDLSLPVIGLLFVPPTLVIGFFIRTAIRGAKSGELRALLVPWAIPFVVFGVLNMGTSVVLAAGADWAGLTVSAVYAALAAIAAHAAQNRILPYVSTAFVTLTVIFASRMFGLGWSASAVVWATQGFLMWWGGQAFGALSRRRRLEGNTRMKLQIWWPPLGNTGVRLSWFALAFVVALLFLSPFTPDRWSANVQEATAVLAVLGLLYIGMAFVARRVWFGYLAVAMLLASWTLQLVDREIPYAQAYAIPAGLYLLVIAFFERRRSPRNLPAFIEGGAVLLLVVSSFWQSVVDNPAWAYAILLALESFLLVLWGAVNQTKLPFVGGIVAFIVNVLYQTTDLLSTLPGAWVGLIVGLFLVTVIAGIERRRQQLVKLGREWTSRVSQWRW